MAHWNLPPVSRLCLPSAPPLPAYAHPRPTLLGLRWLIGQQSKRVELNELDWRRRRRRRRRRLRRCDLAGAALAQAPRPKIQTNSQWLRASQTGKTVCVCVCV